MRLALAVILLGCAPKTDMEHGPTIHASITDGTHTVYDSSSSAKFELETGKTDYDIAIQVRTSDASMGKQSFGVERLNVAVAVGGTMLPAPAMTSDGKSEDPTFASKPFTIPGAQKGKMLVVHVEGVDSRGLHTNIIDVPIALQ